MIIRQAKPIKSDCDLMFELSNDPIVRKASFNQEKIQYSEHCKWYEDNLANVNVLFFLVFTDIDETEFIGQIRFKRNSEHASECIISLSITEQFRGKHMASEFLELGIKELSQKWGLINTVVAEVKEENVPSNSLFSSYGFSLSSEANTYKLEMLKRGMIR
jgi:RimJ/RimL family protein N-acetyltransferase